MHCDSPLQTKLHFPLINYKGSDLVIVSSCTPAALQNALEVRGAAHEANFQQPLPQRLSLPYGESANCASLSPISSFKTGTRFCFMKHMAFGNV